MLVRLLVLMLFLLHLSTCVYSHYRVSDYAPRRRGLSGLINSNDSTMKWSLEVVEHIGVRHMQGPPTARPRGHRRQRRQTHSHCRG